MKQIILILGLGFAVCTNAANFKWTAVDLYTASSTAEIKTAFSGTVSLYAIIEGMNTLVDTYATTDGKVLATKPDGQFEYDFDKDNNGVADYSTLDFFFTYESEGKTYTSATKTDVSIPSSVSSQPIQWNSVKTYTNGTWSGGESEGVPEPTSALLVMMGLAGLALRRKQK